MRSAARRRLAIQVFALMALAFVWVRPGPIPDREEDILRIIPVEAVQPPDWPEGLVLRGIWQLDSKTSRFGGFSALIAMKDGRLRAYSDRGHAMEFAAPPAGSQIVRITRVTPDPSQRGRLQDIEGAAFDPVSGDVWLTYEYRHAVRRFPGDGATPVRLAPEAMRGWPRNGGAEAVVRLADGRFIVLGEAAARFSNRPGPGLLFAGDPVTGAAAQEFRFDAEDGFQPVDMALLPDGRVLILLRAMRFAWPPFGSAIAIADPAAIREGEAWEHDALVEFAESMPRENYEGMEVIPGEDGRVTIWLISDDNNAALQRTLLVRLEWNPAGVAQIKTREETPARSD